MLYSQFNPVWVGVVLAIAMSSWAAADHQEPITDGPDDHAHEHDGLDPNRRADPEAPLIQLDSLTSDSIVSPGPNAKVIKNLTPTARGIRRSLDATTDVWTHGNFAYTGTFESPCGGEPEAGIWVWDTHNVQKDQEFPVTIIESPEDSRSNDVKVATMNSGDILVHSNEVCRDGGIGGFEIYSVDDPENPLHLASVQTDDVNALLRDAFGFVDFGVHNLFLFTQGEKDYVAAVVESEFGNFQIFDITDPMNPELVGFWGAEQLHRPDVTDWVNLTDFNIILDADAFLFDGFGASQNRFLHDITVTADGQQAYLANWDAGLVLLDISDPAEPELVSVAIDPVNGSLDGEVNSHSVWSSEDGSIVVEGEEDFSAWEGTVPPSNLTIDSSFPGDPTIPATAVSTEAGDDFEANQTGNSGSTDGSEVVVTSGPLDGNTYPAAEFATAAGSPIFADTGEVSGEFVWIGRACTVSEGDTLLNTAAFDTGDIAVVRRGACFFEEKVSAAAGLGAAAVVIANNQASTPWSGLRIWDYSDPANPVLASTFNTVCSASTVPTMDCLAGGTYSAHNVIVESTDEAVKAYVSWYWDGMLVLDVTDPYNPVEVARFSDQSTEFQFENGGPQDLWGVYKISDEPWIYGSDRNGGLYILKELGQGTLRAGK